jgi:type III secretion system YscQ/HrcQ family protein
VRREERTQLVTAPVFAASGKAWRPFTFKGLEKVSRSQLILSEKLEWLLPSSSSTGRASPQVLARLQELFELEADLRVDLVHVIHPKELRRFLAEPTFLATLAPLPHKPRGLIEIELGLAHAGIDILLGGGGETVALRPLTDIEEGVMSFVVLEALRALSPSVAAGLPRLRMEAILRNVEEAAGLLGDASQVMVVQFRCDLGPHSGFIRIFLPSAVLGMATPPEHSPEAAARRNELFQRNASRLTGVKAWLRAEVGRVEIASSDLASLRPGDVVLADEISVRSDQGEPGTAELRVGTGRVGRMDAEIFLEDGRYQARIADFAWGEAAREDAPEAPPSEGPDEGTDEDDDVTNPTGARMPGERSMVDESTNKEGGELLNDIPLQIAVELARVPITAEQVVSLRVGQVVDLNRVPGEPVELSVNGKIVARGELVEVEGHLGVRILNMAG